jgi:putative colanic acid biosysnthesis UDP-glucose lipid carrier transferase
MTAPLWPVIALAIKAESSGPVVFRQRRRGRYQSTIEILKFRTMDVIEDGANVRQAVPGDARITAVGRFLRRTSLDELPQLINVLKGEMSLVGPRPHALVHDEEFSQLLDIYADRHQMRPGMTGLAQVTGHRGETSTPGSIEARVNADMDYIRTWTPWLDVKILFNTIRIVITGKNAG